MPAAAKSGAGILPGVAAVVHAVQRQHHRPGLPVRQPGAIGQAHAVRHDEGVGGLARAGLRPGPAAQDAPRSRPAGTRRQAAPSAADGACDGGSEAARLKAWGASLSYGRSPAIEDAKQQDGRHRRQPDADRNHPCRRAGPSPATAATARWAIRGCSCTSRTDRVLCPYCSRLYVLNEGAGHASGH